MKTLFILAIFHLILSAVAAYLISKMSFIGKIGIGLFYKEYAILKSPVETGIVIFTIEMAIVLLLFLVYKIAPKKITNIFATIVMLLTIIGLGFTIYDFTYEFSHKILKTKFHVGFYLVWIGMMVSSLVFLLKPKHYKLNKNYKNHNQSLPKS